MIPGKMGLIARGMARFAVPFFFAVTGYFSFGANGRTIERRLFKIIRLMFFATLLYLLWGCIEAHCFTGEGIRHYLSRKITVTSLSRWLFLEQNPFAGHLWYLTASTYLYFFLIIFLHLSNSTGKVTWHGTFRTVGIVGICIAITLDLFANGNGLKVAYNVYRNLLCLGAPLFSMGLFVHSHQRIIRQNIVSKFGFTRLRIVIIGGLVLSALQETGVGKSEIPIGSLISACVMIILADSFPIPKSRFLVRLSTFPLSKISTYIYIIHPIVGLALRYYMNTTGVIRIAFISYSFPFIILILSLLFSTVISYICTLKDISK